MPRREREPHLHQYDDNWQCKCGFRLITNLDSKSGWVQVKAYVTPEGKTLPLRESRPERISDQQSKPKVRGSKRN